MRVLLLEVRAPGSSSVYKDFAGGLGPGFRVGGGLGAKLLEVAKHWGVRLPNTAFGYLSAIFRARGHDVRYAVNGDAAGADLVLIQASLTDSRAEIAAARRCRASGAKVGFIGLLAGSRPESFLEAADFVVKGEPEALMAAVADGSTPVPTGLVESPAVPDLDSLPAPDWGPFPTAAYRYFPSLLRGPVLPVLSSRGCAYKCNYCPYIAQFKDWRYRSPPNVVDEIEGLVGRHRVRGVLFRDPLFTYPMDRASEIAGELRRRDLRVPFACETRVDCLTPGLLEELAKAGLRTVNVGIETLDREALRRAQRTEIPVERQREIVSCCHRLGINVTAFYMLGLPADTPESARRTIAYARELNTLVANFTVFTPFPGVAAAEQVADRIVVEDLESYDSYHLVFRHDRFTPEDLDRLRERAFISYYWRPRYAWRLATSLWRGWRSA